MRATLSLMAVTHSTPVPRLWWALLPCALVSLFACERTTGLAQKYGDVVVVTHAHGLEAAEREGTQAMDPVSMGQVGSVVVAVRNQGRASATLVRVAQVGGSEALSLELAGAVHVAPGADAPLTVAFQAPQAMDATLAQETFAATFALTFEGTAPGDEVVTLHVTAVAVAGECRLPARLDFGVVPPGVAVDAVVAFDNPSALDVVASVQAPAGDDAAAFTVAPLGELPVGAGQPGQVTLTFAPTEARAYAATWRARRAASCPEGTVQVVGAGSLSALDWAPRAVDFGRVPVGAQATRTVGLRSAVGVALPVGAVTVSGPGFSLLEAPSALQGTAEVRVACRPAALGALHGALSFEVATRPATRGVVPLTCAGGGPRVRVLPAALELGLLPLPNTGPPVTVTRTLHLQNVGTPPVAGDVGANLFLGQGGQPPFWSVRPLDTHAATTTFAVGVPPSYDPQVGVEAVAGRNELPLTLQVTPTDPGPFEAELTLYTNDGVTPATVVRVSGTVERTAPCSLSVEPRVLDFGALPRGSVSTLQLVLTALSAPGVGRCLVSNLELAGRTPGAFAMPVADPGTWLMPGESYVVPVSAVIDANLAAGTTLSAYLSLTTSAAAAPRLVVPLTATVADCLIAVPSALQFGAVQPGCRSGSRAVSLYNLCSTAVPLFDLATRGAGFGLDSAPFLPDGGLWLVPGGAPVTASVVFEPAGEGASHGALVASAAEGGRPVQLTVPLDGTGLDGGQQVDVFELPATPAVDILFTVDDSCSMADKQQSLAANFASFIADATTSRTDYRLAVTTTDDSPSGPRGRLLSTANNPQVLTPQTPSVATRFAEKVNVGTSGSGYEQPLATSIAAVTPPLTQNANLSFLRDTATLSVVVVTDAVDQSPEPAAYYLGRLLGVKAPSDAWKVSFNAIGPFSWPVPAGCTYDSVADPGRYRQLIDATNGQDGDICTSDWARELAKVGRGTFASPTRFPLSGAPAPGTSPTVEIDGHAATGWRWDAATNTVIFPTGAGPRPGTRLTVAYRPACY